MTPPKSTYYARLFCENCRALDTRTIEQGVTIEKFVSENKCTRCGCPALARTW